MSMDRAAHGRRLGGLVWESIRWRLGSSLVFLFVAVAAVTAATAGPIYLAAANQSVTTATLTEAAPSSVGIFLLPPAGVAHSSPGDIAAALAAVPGGSGAAAHDRYEPAVVTVDVSASLPDRKSKSVVGVDLLARPGVCAHLHLVAGQCPTSADTVLLSTRSASFIGLTVGSHVRPVGGRRLVVCGLYAAGVPDTAYWWGQNPFDFGANDSYARGNSKGPLGPVQFVDDGFVTAAGAATQSRLPTSVYGQLPLRPSAVAADEIPLVLSQLAAYETSLQGQLTATSGLPGVLQGIEQQESEMQTIVGAVALELVLLALLVLYQVAASNGAERSGDLEIAELRGLRRRSIAMMALREPALLLLVATPVGLALGWLLVALLSPHLFVAGAPARIDALAVTVAVLTFVGGFTAAVLGSRSLLRPALATEGRAAGERRRRLSALLVDLLALGLAVAALLELVSTHSSAAAGAPLDPLASLAPGAVALAAGVLGARLLPLASRPLVRMTRWSSRVAVGLASRTIMRSAGVARRVVVLVIAVGVLAFSVAGYHIAAVNRATQAEFQVGAPEVLTVQVRPGVNFVQAVEAADPSGDEAMAAAKINSTSPTLAVDSSRFAAVASWPPGTTTSPATAKAVAAYLHPPQATAPEVTLAGADAIRFRVSMSHRVVPAPLLQLNIYDEQDGTEATLNLAPGLHTGSFFVGSSLDEGCLLVCRLDSIAMLWSPSPNSNLDSVDVPLLLSDLEVQRHGVWAPVDVGLTQPGDWLQRNVAGGGTSSSTVLAVASPQGLLATFDDVASAPEPAVGPDDLPQVVPVVATTMLAGLSANPAQPGVVPVSGLDGVEFSGVTSFEAWALPGVGANGDLMDLSFAEAEEQGPPGDVIFEVWLRHAPSAALLAGLASRGVTVTGEQTSAAAALVSGRTAPSLAFDLFLLAAAGAALLALGALMFSVASDSRRRSLEFSALVAVGVPVKVLRRSLLLEQVVIVVVATVLGLAAGLVAGALSLGLLPEFPPGRAGPLLPTSVSLGAVDAVVAAAILLVLLLTGGILASLLTMRRVRPDNVRSST
ncbi:MAG: FtsX-like permease family protein [Acidimicrobiales bacterium]|jgi:hypothetical protein